MPYAIIVMGKEAPFPPAGHIVTQEGDLFWVTDEPEGWVDATSTRCTDRNRPPKDLKVFDLEEMASYFAAEWEGHPWWCKPMGYEVVEVQRVLKTIPDGWRTV